MIKRIQFGILFIIAATFAVDVQAQEDLKIGILYTQLVYERMPEMKAVQQKITNFRDRKENEIRQMSTIFFQAQRNLQQKANVMSEAAFNAQSDTLQMMYQALEQATQNADIQVNNRRVELLRPLYAQIQEAIDNVADRQGLAYVINRTTSQGERIILYADPEFEAQYDITDAVLRELGI